MGSQSSVLNMGTSDFSLEAWIRTSTNTDIHTIIEKGGVADYSPGYWFTLESADELVLRIGNGTSRLTADSNNGLVIDDGNWHHVAVTADRDGVATFYLDGASVGTESISTFSSENIDTTEIFRIGYSPTDEFWGVIDEVRAWSDVRTSTEVNDNMRKTLVGSESNLIGYWRLDEGPEVQSPIEDSSPSNLDGQLGSTTGSDANDPIWSSGYWPIRHKPMFKIRNYHQNSKPSSVTLEGASLVEGTDYNVDYKPVSDAYFADELTWASTLESSGAVTSPDVGSAGTVGGTASFTSGKYGNGALVDASAKKPFFPASGNFNDSQGTVEFWYKTTGTPTAYAKFFDNGNGVNTETLVFQRNNNNTNINLCNTGAATIYGAWDGVNINVFDGGWHHILLNYDISTDSPELWIDGVEETLDSSANMNQLSLQTNVYVGNRGFDDRSVGGIIDEFKVYNQVLRPADLIAKG